MVGGGDAEMALLMDRRQQLQQEMNSTQVAISQLEKDITRLRDEIPQLEEKNELLRDGVKELVRKTFLMNAHTLKCSESVQVAKEFSSRMASRLQLFRYNQQETTYFARTTTSDNGVALKQSITLESACTKQLRSVCEQMQTVVHLHDNPNISSDEMDKHREKVWNQLEQVMATYSPAEVVDSLAQLTASLADELRKHTSAINLQQDSQQLQYKFVGGEMMYEREEREDNSLLKSIHYHIQGLQLDHIQRAVRSETAKRNVSALQQRLSDLKMELDNLIAKSAGSVEELIKSNLNLDLEHSGYEEALQTMQASCAGLKEVKEKCVSVLESLQKKHDQIKEFTQLSESKQVLIQCLVKHNSGTRQQLCEQQTKALLYIKDNVCAHEVELLQLITSTTDGISRELALFSSLSSARLLFLHKLGCSVGDLSINSMRCVSPLQPMLCVLGIPMHSASDQLLINIVKMFDKVDTLRSEIEEAKLELKELHKSHDLQGNVKDIIIKVEQYDTCRREEKLPLLQTSMLCVSKSLAQCVQVRHTLDEWWEQPAQYLTPWVMYEGMDVAKWIEQWNCFTNKLRQLTILV